MLKLQCTCNAFYDVNLGNDKQYPHEKAALKVLNVELVEKMRECVCKDPCFPAPIEKGCPIFKKLGVELYSIFCTEWLESNLGYFAVNLPWIQSGGILFLEQFMESFEKFELS